MNLQFCFARISILLICLWPLHTNSKHPSYYDDNMGRQEKDKLIYMTKELLVDGKAKQRQVHGIREIHSNLLTYEVGLVIGKIGEKYKRMMDIYRQMIFRRKGRFNIMPPTLFRIKPIHYLYSMELVHTLETDIDKMIHVLKFVSNKDLNNAIRISWSTIIKPSVPKKDGKKSKPTPPRGSGPNLRASENDNALTPKPRFANEEELKQFYRDQFEAKSGRNGNWTLDQYYGFM